VTGSLSRSPQGLLDDVIRPEIADEDVILELDDHCIDVGCEQCKS
jgi:hypothetical protein